ncbi:MAG TPA: GspE/PulE family protein [Opitutaceae bacterium]|nr:GspE/PulE family protein [Opitutaceae bacterium]
MFAGHDPAVAALLRDAGLLTAETLAALSEECRLTGEPLAGTVVARGFVSRGELLRRAAEYLGLGWAADPPRAIAEKTIALVPGDLARRYAVVPLDADVRSIALLAGDPFDGEMAGELTFALGRDVRLVVADPARVADLLRQHYPEPAAERPAGEMGAGLAPAAGAAAGAPAEADLARMAGRASVVRFVNVVLSQAVRERASDIHFEPFEQDFKVRCRIDGTLRDVAPPPRSLALPVISRLKVLAGLNIAERRLPQDGRIRFDVDGRSVDLRISTLPTQSGESVVLRVLDRSAAPLQLAELGMPAEIAAGLQEIIHRPNGILLVTGPTGSGKTTTLYGCLRLINQPELKILTAEDPVEYETDGVMQLPVNPAIGLTFAAALRSFLRQDPDVLMVGEIRDLETAQVAIQAALTGHLVLSTLHTNDAAGAITRLIDMGVEPFLLCATLEAVLAQRLVRRVCPDCREDDQPAATLLARFDGELAGENGRGFSRGRGCEACRRTGYKGRTGVFEWLRMNEALRELVMRRAPGPELTCLAVAQGMRTLRTAGVRAASAGRTTLEEVARVV